MSRFLKSTLFFITTSILLLACFIAIPATLVSSFSAFDLSREKTVLLFGHSHSECAFNDSLIKGFKNLSHSAEPYFYTYQKVKKYLDRNGQVKTVLIEFSNNQIDEKMNEWTWGYKYMSNMFPQYSSFMTVSDLEVLVKNNPGDMVNCVSIAARDNLIKVLLFDYSTPGWGGYLKLNRTYDAATSNKATLKMPLNQTTSAVNLLYLRKIIDYCKLKNKHVFLVRSPQYADYEFLNNEAIFMSIKQHYFNDVSFLDFNDFPLKATDFADPGHLNYGGAIKFSTYFNKLLVKGILN